MEFLIGKTLTLRSISEKIFETIENVLPVKNTLEIRKPENAFAALDILGVLTYDQAKSDYYRARENKHVRAMLITNVNDVPLPSIEKLEAVDRRAVEKYGREKQPFAVITRASVYACKPGEDLKPITADGTCKIYAVNKDAKTELGQLRLGK